MRIISAFIVTVSILVISKPSSGTDFGCGIEFMEDAEREQALNFHNQLRSEVALGNVLQYVDYDDYYGPASNMYKLAWNCSLEQKLHDAIQGCQSDPSTTVPAEFGLNFKYFASGSAIPSDLLSTTLTEWREQYVPIEPTNIVEPNMLEFANMVNSKTLSVACSKQKCDASQSAIVACIYDQPSLKTGDEMFTEGNPCSTNADCTTYTPAVCNSAQGLCEVNVESTTTTTTTPANVHPNPEINKICPSNANMNDRIRTKVLDMVNYRRSQLAKGAITKVTGKNLPKAANMMQLKYDCDLEKSAYTNAATCSRTNSYSSSNVGETVRNVPFSSTVTTRVEAIADAVQTWWRKIKTEEVSIGMLVTFKQQHVNAPIRTFTTLAWATTTSIGCGVQKCTDFFFVVCHYQPKGNIVSSVVYQTGEPCSMCPSGTSCVTPLCVP